MNHALAEITDTIRTRGGMKDAAAVRCRGCVDAFRLSLSLVLVLVLLLLMMMMMTACWVVVQLLLVVVVAAVGYCGGRLRVSFCAWCLAATPR